MFDFCRADVDFTNLEHLACTEVQLYKALSPSPLIDGIYSVCLVVKREDYQNCSV